MSRDVASVDVLGAGEIAILAKKQNRGANWFLLIAGLGFVNSVIAFMGTSNIKFMLGVAVIDAINELALLLMMQSPTTASLILTAIAIDLVIIGLFVGLGILGKRRHPWAFVVGMVLYALDLLIVLVMGVWIGVAFHLYALYCLWQGWQASRTLKRHLKAGSVAVEPVI